jgi:hypothetical protein
METLLLIVRLGLVVRPDKLNKATAACCLSILYNDKSKITCAVLRVLVQQELDHVRTRLAAMRRFVWHPVMLPLIVVETRTGGIPQSLEKHKDVLKGLEIEAGVYKNQYFKDSLGPGAFIPSDKDFDALLGKVTPITGDCIYLQSKCELTLGLLDFIETTLNELRHTSSSIPCTEFERNCEGIVNAKLMQCRTYASNTLNRCKYVNTRANILVSTVS